MRVRVYMRVLLCACGLQNEKSEMHRFAKRSVLCVCVCVRVDYSVQKGDTSFC